MGIFDISSIKAILPILEIQNLLSLVQERKRCTPCLNEISYILNIYHAIVLFTDIVRYFVFFEF